MKGSATLFFLIFLSSFLAFSSLLLSTISLLWSRSRSSISSLAEDLNRDMCNRYIILSFLSGSPLPSPCGSEDTFVETAVVEGHLVVVRDAHRVYGP